jgi:hypothetical protein
MVTFGQSRAMIIRKYFGHLVTLPVLFVVLAGIPLAALGWLAWRLLLQDRALEDQRLREQLENAATLLTRELDHSLATWEDVLALSETSQSASGKSIDLPSNAVVLVFDSGGVLQQQGLRLPYYPHVASPPEAPSSVFVAAEAQEFREEDLAKAAISYRSLASTKDRFVRAAALMRLARCLRKERQLKDALAVYGELAELGETPVGGSPSELLARRERVALFKTIGDDEAAAHEAASLASTLWEGRLRIDRATFDFFRDSTPLPPTANLAVALAEAVQGLWPLWKQQAAGRAAWTGDGRGFVAVWRQTPTGTAALLGGVDTMMASSVPMMRNLQVGMVLEDSAGRRSWGALPLGGVRATKTSRETGLPWTIQVAATDLAAAREVSTARRRLLSAGFGLMVLVIAAASYFVFRSVNRELRLPVCSPTS